MNKDNYIYIILSDHLDWDEIIITTDYIKANTVLKNNKRIETFVKENGKYLPLYSSINNDNILPIKHLFLVLCNFTNEWEDYIFFDNINQAKEYVKNNKKLRIETFTIDEYGYFRPTYD